MQRSQHEFLQPNCHPSLLWQDVSGSKCQRPTECCSRPKKVDQSSCCKWWQDRVILPVKEEREPTHPGKELGVAERLNRFWKEAECSPDIDKRAVPWPSAKYQVSICCICKPRNDLLVILFISVNLLFVGRDTSDAQRKTKDKNCNDAKDLDLCIAEPR